MSDSKTSLRETFSKVNHARHILMDVAMMSAAIALVVSSGGLFGIVDPIGVFLNMHVPAMSDLAVIGDFTANAFNNAANGLWVTDAAFLNPHSVHAGHVASAGTPQLSESAMQLLGIQP
ncbi:MAG: hypothetical protein ACLFR0_09330 [Alphaproteobacteria bacterium]